MSEPSPEYCSNCKHEIPAGNFEMHMIHCKRNLQLCPICDERVLRTELKNHTVEFHSLIRCTECNTELQRSDLENHMKSICKKRIVPCQHCDLELKADDIEEHEDYCGSRTEPCEGCGKLIMLKFQHLHLDSNHKFLKFNEVDSDSDVEDRRNTRREKDYEFSKHKRRTDKQRHIRFPNAGSSSYLNSSNMNGHRQRNTKLRNHASELDEYFQDLDLEEVRIRNNRTAAINRILNRERSPPNTNARSADTALIPCEFCKILVIADNLVLHQTGCRPDLASVRTNDENHEPSLHVPNLPHEGFNQNNERSNEDTKCVREALVSSEPIIPCEFCLQLYSIDDISGHQYVCRRNNHVV